MPLCDVAAESTSASVVDESTSAGGAGGVVADEVPEDESMEISPPGPACLAGPTGPNEAPPEALANAAAAAGLSTPSSNSLEGEVNLPSNLPSPLRLDGAGSPAEPHGGAMDGPLPETEAKQRGLKRAGGGASEPWSPIAALGEGSRLSDDEDQATSTGTNGSKRLCGDSRSAQPARPAAADEQSRQLRRELPLVCPPDPASADNCVEASSGWMCVCL